MGSVVGGIKKGKEKIDITLKPLVEEIKKEKKTIYATALGVIVGVSISHLAHKTSLFYFNHKIDRVASLVETNRKKDEWDYNLLKQRIDPLEVKVGNLEVGLRAHDRTISEVHKIKSDVHWLKVEKQTIQPPKKKSFLRKLADFFK